MLLIVAGIAYVSVAITKIYYEVDDSKWSDLNLSYTINLTGILLYSSNETCGKYNSDEDKIYININRTNCDSVIDTILHEFKHRWCWMNHYEEELNLSNKCEKGYNKSDDGYYDCRHQGCFLNTPIDQQYGFID